MNNFMMSDMLRVCDEFGAWLIRTEALDIVPKKAIVISCGYPDFSKIEGEKWYELFYTFCAQNPDTADEIPADDGIVNMIVRSVFKYYLIGGTTIAAINELREKLVTEGRMAK